MELGIYLLNYPGEFFNFFVEVPGEKNNVEETLPLHHELSNRLAGINALYHSLEVT